MAAAGSSRPRRDVSLEDLIVLNDEIAAAVRAGLPLESELDRFGRAGGGLARARSSTLAVFSAAISAATGRPRSAGRSGRLKQLTDRLAERMSAGRSLEDALQAEESNLPGVYLAVVQSGVRVGRLPDALESLSALGKSELELRRQVGLALLYPVLVLLLAYALFVAFIALAVPRLDETYRMFNVSARWWLPVLEALSETVLIWGPLIPVIFVLVIMLAAAFGRNRFSTPRIGSGLFDQFAMSASLLWLPGLSGMIRDLHRALFCEMLSLLTEHGVPLHESFRLAGESTSERDLSRVARNVAELVETGQSLDQAVSNAPAAPPYMKWIICTAARQGRLAESMRELGEHYRRRALHGADWCRVVLPIVAIVAVGGGATLIYALALFGPITELFQNIGQN